MILPAMEPLRTVVFVSTTQSPEPAMVCVAATGPLKYVHEASVAHGDVAWQGARGGTLRQPEHVLDMPTSHGKPIRSRSVSTLSQMLAERARNRIREK